MTEQKHLTKRNVNGILLLDKPSGISSNHALQKVKKIFHANKAGHTGSLDPLASGILPICLGEATKFSQFLLDANKSYSVSALLGIQTTTSDKEGECVSKRPVPRFDFSQLDTAFDSFRGEIDQIPSMFSALKYQGQPLYRLARNGITVHRPSRRISVYELKLKSYQMPVLNFDVQCSKGTYVRTLVDDYGEALGCGAHVIALRRRSVGAYLESQIVRFDVLESLSEDVYALDKLLLPVSTSVSHLPEIILKENEAFCIRKGQSVIVLKSLSEGMVRLTTHAGHFLGVGEIMRKRRLVPKRLLSSF